MSMNNPEVERIAQTLYHADLNYDGSGDRYGYLARAVHASQAKESVEDELLRHDQKLASVSLRRSL